mmetsp:Transcript_18208/g.41352  ORF Transcript_18208/g.41352 Transcript_18208/m.41352 type:complete len:170 (-) Transcript_18208:687-1196(-)
MHWRLQMLNRAVCQRPAVLDSKLLLDTRSSRLSEDECDVAKKGFVVYGGNVSKRHDLHLASGVELAQAKRESDHHEYTLYESLGVPPNRSDEADQEHPNEASRSKVSRINVSVPSSRDPFTRNEDSLKLDLGKDLAESHLQPTEQSPGNTPSVEEAAYAHCCLAVLLKF